MPEEIITLFKADLSELEAGVAKGEKLIEGYTDSTNKAIAAEDNLGKASGNAAVKVQMLAAASQRGAQAEAQLATEGKKAAVSQEQLATSTDKVGGKLNIFQRITQGIRNAFNGLVNGVKGFGQGAKEGFDKAVTGGTKAGSVIQSLSGNLTSAVGGAGSLGGVFSALTGPIGIAAAAVSGFIANFSRLDTVQVFLDGVRRGFDQILTRLTSFEGFKGLFNPAEAAKDAAIAAQFAQRLDQIEDAQRGVTVANAEADKQLASLNQKLRDRTLGEQERLKVADDITAIEEKRATKEIAAAQEQLKFVNDEIKNELRLGVTRENLKDELLDRQAEAEAAVSQAQARSIQLTETVERRRNAIVDQGINERAATEQKAIAARDKALRDAEQEEAKRVKKQQDIAQVEGQILTITTELDDADLKSGLSEIDVKLLDTEKKFVQIAANIKRSFASLRQVSGLENAIGEPTEFAATPEGKAQGAEITTRETTVLQNVNTASIAAANEIRALEAAKQIGLERDTAAKVLEITQTSNQEQLQAIRDKYEALLEEVDNGTADEVTKNAQRIQLIVAQERDLIDAQLEATQAGSDKLFETKAVNDAIELQQIRDKYDQIRELNEAKAESEEELRQLNTEATLLEDQELFETLQEQKAEQDELEAERLQKTIDIAEEMSAHIADLLTKAAEDGKVTAEELGKALVGIFLDTVEKILLIKAFEISVFLIEKGAEQGGLPGAILGAIAGAVIIAALQAAFAGIKSAVAGNYEGDPYVEGKPTWSGRDGYLRRLDKGERVVKAKDNQRYWEPLEAMRKGKFEQWVDQKAVDATYQFEPFALNADMDMMHRVNRYMDGDQGQRLAQSIMFPKYFDRNLVKSQERTNEELHENNMLLGVLIEQGKRNQRHARSW